MENMFAPKWITLSDGRRVLWQLLGMKSVKNRLISCWEMAVEISVILQRNFSKISKGGHTYHQSNKVTMMLSGTRIPWTDLAAEIILIFIEWVITIRLLTQDLRVKSQFWLLRKLLKILRLNKIKTWYCSDRTTKQNEPYEMSVEICPLDEWNFLFNVKAPVGSVCHLSCQTFRTTYLSKRAKCIMVRVCPS